MPTFLIFKNSSVVNTLRGADPNALRSAILAASADAAKSGPKSSASFQTKGHVLGGEDTPSRAQSGTVTEQANAFFKSLMRVKFLDTFIRFVGLYLVTLFSLDPKTAASTTSLGRDTAAKRR
jgi:thioredoxin 1